MNSLSSAVTPPPGTGVTGIRPVAGEDGAGFDRGTSTGGAVAVGGGGCLLCPQPTAPIKAANNPARHNPRNIPWETRIRAVGLAVPGFARLHDPAHYGPSGPQGSAACPIF